ncbi:MULTISPECIES: 50S ribosomal protein L29 [Reichenbachiella]|uniref:Large ribosomal subunit protein uL29 n=1 Tax=Reichenbachiella agariperforans TaxID=156994 RepID=A0A1M6RNG6_REIAG|nr:MULTISPECIES: 50S ribosomal protein L29 [Reichenbachiella]MBU2915056.1 50S ribosomal protein L29 [Reichenbachiella agariperforans]RJE70483.1 50S ribosomal protein L29 [Reichenbachiella sp. MSK19-1]SHK34002.1 large subunit ribosomal protein L29 [Reichenbachiella agariperforans]
MKNSEIQGLSLEELKTKVAAEKDSLAKLQFAHAITPIENPMRLKDSRKLVARLNTEIRAKELAQQ